MKLKNIQGTTIVMEGLIAETNVHLKSFNVINVTRKLLNIYRLNCKKLHLVSVFRG